MPITFSCRRNNRLLTEARQPNRSPRPMPLTLHQPRPTHLVLLASNQSPLESLTTPTERTGGGNRRRKRRRKMMMMMETRTTKLRAVTQRLQGAAVIPAPRLSGPAPSVRPPSLTMKTIWVT